MKLKAILNLHQKTKSARCLPKSLGDAYLLKHNPIFRTIREHALKSGYCFSAERFHDYDAMALTQLPKILTSKTIPYRDNVRPLLAIERMRPGQFLIQDLPPLRENYLFHESAHAVAHEILVSILARSKKTAQASDSTLTFHTLIEESFANATESLANIYANDAEHEYFLAKNAYLLEKLSVRKMLRKAVDCFGFEPIFILVFFSFLHANFLRADDQNAFDRCLKIIFKSPPHSVGLLRRVYRTGLDLDPEFTDFTNSFCLKLMGIKDPFQTIARQDCLAPFEHQDAYRQLLVEFAHLFAA